MKIVSCYIESFGKIKNQSFSFRDGLTKMLAKNGSGKTTLAAFIKAMLYGMNDNKKTSLEENDRKHYLPWSGGIASGSLEFSVGNKRYRAERCFGNKASEDSFVLYDLSTGRISRDYSNELGKEIFGIDADGFERTVFLSERNLSEAGGNPTVSAKLGGLVGEGGDIEGIDKALAALDEERKHYSRRGGVGKIYDIRSAITDTEIKLSELAANESRLSSEQARLLEGRMRCSEIEEELKRLDAVKERLIYKKAESASREGLSETLAALEQKQKELLPYSRFFAEGAPSYEEINEMSCKATEAKRLLESRTENPEYERLKEKFKNTESGEMEQAAAAVSSLEKDGDKKDEKKKKKKSPLPTLFSVLGILCIIIGVVLGSNLNMLYFGVCALGIFPIIISVVLSMRAKEESKFAESELTREEQIKLLKKLLQKLHIDCGDNVLAVSASLVKEYGEYTSLSAFMRYKSSENEGALRRGGELMAEVNAFLGKYDLPKEHSFEALRGALGEYEKLTRELEILKSEVSRLQRNAGTSTDGEIGINEESLAKSKASLEEKLGSLRREAASSERNIRSLGASLEEKDELILRKEELTDQLSECEEKFKILQLTKELLTEARDSMSSKYLTKTKRSFEEYTKLISKEEAGVFELNTVFSVSRLEGGRARAAEGYSRGTRDLYALASRLAVIDSLYEGETPPLILDDPFIGFDDAKAKAALTLLENLAKTRQIIYFTCSESRS